VSLGLATVRDGIATSRYRSEYTKARWWAEGCLAEFRARLERRLSGSIVAVSSAASVLQADAWMDPRPLIPKACTVTLAPPPDGPVDVNSAPESTLLRLPGFDAEVVEALVRARVWGRIAGLDQLISELPAHLGGRLAAHYAELAARAAFSPPAWVATAPGDVSGHTVPMISERWARAGSRIAVVRREVR
jgi:hypothetical protein